MYVLLLFILIGQVRVYGTGSYPCPPHGWHLSMRRMARYIPLKGPCLRNASMAYWLHVGVNLHEGGVSGDMHSW